MVPFKPSLLEQNNILVINLKMIILNVVFESVLPFMQRELKKLTEFNTFLKI